MRDHAPYSADEIAKVVTRIKRTSHPKQRPFVFDTHRRVTALVGRGGGKTAAMLFRLILAMLRQDYANCLFIAATRDSAERLVWRDLKRALATLRLVGDFNESKLTCTLPNGSRLHLFGCDDKRDIQKLRGITYHEVGVDEVASINADLLRELLVEVIGPRMVGTLCLIGTPGKQLEGTFYDATRPGSSEHRPWADRDKPEYAGWIKWSSHSWTVMDGAEAGIEAMEQFLEIAKIEKLDKGWSDTNPYWAREYLGQWMSDGSANVYLYRPHLDDGAEWNQWTPKINGRGFAELPVVLKDIGYGIGIDVGFKDAFALEIFAFSFSDPKRVLYHVYEIYQTRLYAQAIAKLLIGEALNHDRYGGIIGAIGWPDVMVGDFAGSGGALLVELQTVYGITIAAADKAYKYKNNSIELLNSELHDGRVKIMKGSKLAEEMGQLQWVTDQYGKRQEAKNQANHACDASLYLRDALATLLPSAAASAPLTVPKQTGRRDDHDDVSMLTVSDSNSAGDADAMYSESDF